MRGRWLPKEFCIGPLTAPAGETLNLSHTTGFFFSFPSMAIDNCSAFYILTESSSVVNKP